MDLYFYLFHLSGYLFIVNRFYMFSVKVLLVQGFWSKSSWGFPKGKVNEEEPGNNFHNLSIQNSYVFKFQTIAVIITGLVIFSCI